MPSNKKLRVLIIDDDDMMRSFLRIMLRAAEVINIDEAGTAKKAVKLFNTQKFDLIFLDINLPDEDGVVFISTIKNKLPDCQIIMVSSEATKDRVSQAMKSGAKDFIAKPFNATIVESKVKQLVSELV